jgi:hypothetical protein
LRPNGFVRSVARFAIPAGVLVGTGLVAGYLFTVHDLNLSVADARTVTLTTLIANGLYLVMALEAGGSRRRSSLVAGMCVVMGGLYVAALLFPAARSFFALTVPGPGMIVTALAASAVSIGALVFSGYSLHVAPADSDAMGNDQDGTTRVLNDRGGDAAEQRRLHA